ncbi:nitrate reductase [Vulcanimicrobium alpinum]|uniref:Nitrate reductase n=1 Tax=Vulcanimicrobium alpinum TaxID=3016050 RepID=A0AAN1XSW4_UNVUL|nr:NCS1 family nucleobase:cation symporter-1 [Vulcanimicrobium alpinum]BDE05162.1 nitrate reductase [Vulcanimicrobium alpinum]
MVTQAERDGIVTLTPGAASAASQRAELWNDDLRPCTREEHNWRASRFASLWIGMCLCIPTYSLASGMIALGMNWWEATLTIFTGSAVVLVPILLVAHAGTRYGFPYPVFARLWFGTFGAHVPALARAIIGAGWFGINAWFGGLALDAILSRIAPGWSGLGPHTAFAFVAFWLLNVGIAMRGPQAIGRLAAFAAPTLGLAAVALFAWGMHAAGGVAPMLATPASLHGGAFWAAFFPSVIGVVAFWATLALNIPDYSRYAVSQPAQLRGQLVMPLVMALFSFVGIAVTSATVAVYGKALWNPVDLLVTFPFPVVLLGGAIVILSSITINVGANVMAPARAFENLWPRTITFAIGAVMTGLLALLMQPWYVLATFHNYVFTWLGTYGTLLGPFDGIAIADYWLVRARRLDLAGLYDPASRYNYARGWNVRAILALAAGWIPPLIGFVVPALGFLWSGGWFFSIIVAGLAYAYFMRTDHSRLNAAEYATITELDETPAVGSAAAFAVSR